MKKLKFKVKSTIIGAAAGLVAVAGVLCSFAYEPVKASPERVVETLVEAPMVLSARVDAPASEIESETDSEAIAEETVTEGVLAEDIERSIEAIEVNKDYLKDMTEEEITELSREALEASGKDTSLAEGSLVTTGITFEIPEGFEANPDVQGMYVTDRYPIDASNIVYKELGTDYTLQLMEQADFEALIAESFSQAYDKAVDFKITEFKHIEIDDVPAIRLKAEYDLEDNHITQLMIVVNGSKTYSLVYTQTHDYDRMEAFEESAASIHVSR